MNNYFRRLSIRKKLIFAIFFASTLVSLMGFFMLIVMEIRDLKLETINDTRADIEVLSQEFVKIILYGNVDMAADLVAKLQSFPYINNAFLYDDKGDIVFSFIRSENLEMEPPPRQADSSWFDDQFLHIYHPIQYTGRGFGTSYLRVSTDRIQAKLQEYYTVIALVVPVLLLISYLLAVWLQRHFSRPILELADAMSRISETRDYSKAPEYGAPNEIGSLYRSFDRLLQIINQSQEDLRHGEARLAGIIDIAGSGIISTDENMNILLFNRAAETIFGYPASEVVGRPLNILLPQRFRAEHKYRVEEFSATNTVSRSAMNRPDIRGLRKNGEEFPLEAGISRLDIAGHKIFTVALVDVTERRSKEMELERYRNHLEELVDARTEELRTSNRELEAFSYSVAHDLRTPLRSITSFSQLIMHDAQHKLDPEEIDSLQRVVRAGKHMSELIDDLLMLARIGRTDLRKTQINLSELAHGIAARLNELDRERSVKWKIQDQLSARADPQLIRLVLENLLDNAWKYTRKQDTAHIEFGAQEMDGNQVYFVQDDGVGFDMKYADKLFGVFQRLHKAEEYDGTGIGLATVRRIIQRHGGRIWAESAPNKGATFYFSVGS